MTAGLRQMLQVTSQSTLETRKIFPMTSYLGQGRKSSPDTCLCYNAFLPDLKNLISKLKVSGRPSVTRNATYVVV